jgi:hypothetical protein
MGLKIAIINTGPDPDVELAARESPDPGNNLRSLLLEVWGSADELLGYMVLMAREETTRRKAKKDSDDERAALAAATAAAETTANALLDTL